jgi:hypothetical protein
MTAATPRWATRSLQNPLVVGNEEPAVFRGLEQVVGVRFVLSGFGSSRQ